MFFKHTPFKSTFNLPDLTDRFLEGNGTGYIEAGLPNITGEIATRPYSSNSYSGAITYGNRAFIHQKGGGGPDTIPVSVSGTGTNADLTSLDASRSSSIYGNSSTVQPATCKCNFVIKY